MICRQRQTNIVKKERQPERWDHECKEAKREKYRFLRRFRRANSSADLYTFIDHRNKFKQM